MARRTNNLSECTVTFPPYVHFAFNPWLVKITGNSSFASFWLHDDTREPYDGGCEFDIRRYVQSQFDGIPDERLKAIDYTQILAGTGLMESIYCDLIGTMSDGETTHEITFNTWALWGAISRGEEYGGDETLKWWINYPFTVDFLSLDEEFKIEMDVGLPNVDPMTGSSLTVWESFAASGPAVHLFNPSAAWEEAMEGTANWPEIMDAASIKVRVSDHVYLKNQELTESRERTVTLKPDCTPLDAQDRVYVRWVDNLGRIRYWLFTETDQSEAVSASSWNKSDPAEPEIYDGHVNDGQISRQYLTATRTRTLAAQSVSADEFETLVTIARSPIVDVFDGYDDDGNALWHRVNVVAGSYARDRSHLQDFQFSITDRTQSTQEL